MQENNTFMVFRATQGMITLNTDFTRYIIFMMVNHRKLKNVNKTLVIPIPPG